MNILFIGNSYTYYNDLPTLVHGLANENGIDVDIDSLTVGGRRLYENLLPDDEKYAELLSLLAKKRYSVLVLQEQSYTPMTDYSAFKRGVEGLIDLVEPEKTVLYATWGRKEGCPFLVERGLSSAEMTEKLGSAYGELAEIFGTYISRVGQCFAYISQNHPDIELYTEDMSHPSYYGSCVAALVHYKTIFGGLPEKTETLKLDGETLKILISAIEIIKE